MDAGELHGRCGVTARANAAHPQPSKFAGVAERQRQPPSAKGGADVSRYRARHALAEPYALVCHRASDDLDRRDRREDDRALRIRRALLLADRPEEIWRCL